MVTPIINKQTMIIGMVAFGVILFLLIANKPNPIPVGGCGINCREKVVVLPEADFNPESATSSVCGGGYDVCCIKSIKYTREVAKYGWEIVCSCCNCEGSNEATLGKCKYKIPFLNIIGSWLGFCEM
jgi:hypothetical protein